MTKKLYRATEFQSSTGRWHAGDYNHVGANSSAWYYVPRMLNMELTDYIRLLVDTYHATLDGYYEYTDGRPPLLLYSWKNYDDCYKWTLIVNMVNREAKKRNFKI